MRISAYELAKPVLFRLDPEATHERAVSLLKRISASPGACTLLRRRYVVDDPRLEVRLFGRTFPNPLGIAAGFDKNGVAVPALLALGFGSVEVGTVTPLPQPGNPRPRLFRLPEDEALINRLGFPGEGMDAVARNLEATAGRNGVMGINIGPNRTSVDAGTADQDCVAALRRLAGLAAYVVINVSSPNTARLRDLQGKTALAHLLGEVMDAAQALPTKPPILVKVSPDLSEGELNDVLDVVSALDLAGIVATNTTVARPAHLRSRHKDEPGGLSGRPLAPMALAMVRHIYARTRGMLPIIAVGGIFTGNDVLATIAAGASLTQTYTGFVYRGPGMARHVLREVLAAMEMQGIRSLDEVRGRAIRDA
ncbi:MAG: dihydroorotate dehydrogenase (quinone) [Thermomicrobiales bacterium]|nr:MAG: dihydroorotate dehydrogenase (quinone) [Thermomicrobiales bacterium]